MTEQKCFVFRFADVEVREREFRVMRAGAVLPVEPKAFRVLLYLLRNPNKLIPKDELLDAIWGTTAVTENSLTRAVALLRRVLEDDTREPHFIATVATVGYRFVCPVEVVEESSGESEPKTQPIARRRRRGASHAGEPDCCSSRLCEDQSARETWVVADPWISQRRSWTRRWVRVYLLFDATATRAKSFQLRPTHA